MRCSARHASRRSPRPSHFPQLALLACLLVATPEPDATARGDSPPAGTAESPRSAAELNPIDEEQEEDPAVQQILKLRKLVGDPFQGTIFESQGGPDKQRAAEQFAGALREIARQEAAAEEARASRGTGDPSPLKGSRAKCESSYQDLLQAESWEPVPVLPQGSARELTPPGRGRSWDASRAIPGGSEQNQPRSHLAGDRGPRDASSTMRLLARRIGQTADDLEELARYAEADELRQVADRLRHAARAQRESPIAPID